MLYSYRMLVEVLLSKGSGLTGEIKCRELFAAPLPLFQEREMEGEAIFYPKM